MTGKEMADELARDCGADCSKYVGKWNGIDVYVDAYTDGALHCVGEPIYIFVKDDNAYYASTRESVEYMGANCNPPWSKDFMENMILQMGGKSYKKDGQ